MSDTTSDIEPTIAEAMQSILQVQGTESEQSETIEATTEDVDEATPDETLETTEEEAQILEDEADDDLLEELDADLADVQDENEAAPLELSDDMEIEYKSDGVVKRATLGELKRDKAGQDYIQRRMQEVSQLEKQYKQELNALSEQQKQLLDFSNQVQETGFVAPKPPDEALFDDDPLAFMKAKMNYDKEMESYNLQLSKLHEVQEQRRVEQEKQLQEYTNEQTRILAEKLPDIVDPKKGEIIKKKLLEVGKHYGFSPEELNMVRDHRYVLTLHDAMKYRELVNKRKATTSKSTESRTPTVKSGTKKRPGASKAKAEDAARKRFLKSGKIEDAVALMIE